MNTIVVVFEHQSRNDLMAVMNALRTTSQLIRHRPAADDHADPHDERQPAAEPRAEWRSSTGFPRGHLRIEDDLKHGGVDRQQHEKYQLRTEEDVCIRL